MANHTVGIIGTGWVGTSIAISTLHAGVADALWLHDTRSAVAEGEAMDLAQGAAFYPPCAVQVASVEAMRTAQVVVVAAGRNGKPGESRLDLLRDNARVVADIGRTLAGFAGTVVLVSNPVDVLTQVMTEISGLPPERVLGTGTMLDTARLRYTLAERLGVATNSIHAQVVGEHGDSEVVLTVSRMQQGAAGVQGVALSLPAVVGADGARTVIAPALDATEHAALERSADVLRQALATLQPG